jgi:hypothetical protein
MGAIYLTPVERLIAWWNRPNRCPVCNKISPDAMLCSQECGAEYAERIA